MIKISRSLAFVSAFAFISACGGGDDPPPPTETAPKITSTAVTTAKEGVQYSYMITMTGQPTPLLAATNKPAWLTLEGRLLSGTPTRADVGSHEVKLTATNGISPAATQTFTIVVEAADVTAAPAITSVPPANALIGTAYSYVVVATGTPVPTITATGEGGGPLPGWLTFDAATFTLSGTPTVNEVGEHDVIITAANGVSPNATQAFTITVAATGVAPRFTSTPITSGTEAELYSYTVTAEGTPSPAITATVKPDWLVFDAATGVLSGVPGTLDVGDASVTLTANNGINPEATQTFTITVVARVRPMAPSFTSTPPSMALVNALYSYTPVATGNPMPTITATQLPPFLTFDSATGVLSGTPAYADRGGTFSVSLTADNGVAPAAVQAFTIDVTTTAVPPQFTSTPNTNAVEDAVYTYTAVASGNPPPTYTATVLPAWLTFDGATGILTGTPANGDIGTHNVEIVADNVTVPATQSFTIIVVAAPAAPQFTSTPVTDALENLPYSYTVSASGNPQPTLAATTLPPWLIFNATTGLLSGTPGPNDLGPNLVELTAMNGVAPIATQTFTIEVASVPVAPSITSTPVTAVFTGELYTYNVVAAGNPSPTLSASLAGGAPLPGWLSFDAPTGALFGRPTAADVGNLQIEISATNGVSPDALQAFTLAITVFTQAPLITSTPPATIRAGSTYRYVIVATGTPVPTVSVTGLPTWLTFDAAAGIISGTPGAANVGTVGPITVTADNGIAPAATQNFSITVEPFGIVAVAAGPYVQNFDQPGLPIGWSAPASQWVVGLGATGANTVGPPALYDGQAASTGLSGNYPNSITWQLTTPAFDFTGVAAPRLRFAHWYNMERGASAPFTCYDGGNIKISTDGGATFVQLAANATTPAYSCSLTTGTTNPLVGQPAFSGILADWELVTVDLTASLGALPVNNVVFRFDLGSDASVPRRGWYIDAVRVADASALITPPAITSVQPNVSFVSGTPFSYTVAATGTQPITLSATLVGGAPLPAWLTFNAATGVLSGTPAAADGGTINVLITASNGEPRNATQTFNITVIPLLTLAGYDFEASTRSPSSVATNVTANDINNRTGVTTFVAGNPGNALNSNGWVDAVDPSYYEFTVTPATGFQTRLYTLTFDHYRSATGPTNFQVYRVNGTTVTTIAGGAGTIPNATTWTPASITFTTAEGGPNIGPTIIRIAAWGASAAAGTFRLDNIALSGTVAGRDNMAPTFLSTAPTTATVGTPYSYPILTEGWPVPTLTFTGLPAWLTYSAATRTLSGTPNTLFVGVSPTITITAANATTPNATQPFTITVAAGPSAPIVNGTPLIQPFAVGAPAGWGFNGGWEFGVPTVGANTVGPPTVLDGPVAATRLTGNYDASVRWSMTTPAYDLTGVTNPVLQFQHWFNLERSTVSPFTCYDGANIKFSTDGGVTFNQLLPASVTPAYTCALSSGTTQMSGQQGWSGILTDWTFVNIDLAANLAALPVNNVVIRFDMGSDSTAQRPGWYVDNVRIGALADLSAAPVVSSVPRRSARQGTAYSYVVSATGVPPPAITVTQVGGAPLPAWLTYNATTRTLGGTPAAADVASLNINLVATNAAGSVTQTFPLRVFATADTPLFSDGFETGGPTWTTGFDVGTAGEWAIGAPSVVGPPACAAGTQCAATNLTGNYAEEVRLSYLETPVLNLTGLPQPALRFQQWYRTESTYDGGNIKISTDGGITFSPLLPATVVPAYTGVLDLGAPLEGQLTWNGTGTTWTTVNVDLLPNLSGLPVTDVVLRFEFGSDSSVNYAGWYIDSVNVGDFVTLP